jgi:hypothetical protein
MVGRMGVRLRCMAQLSNVGGTDIVFKVFMSMQSHNDIQTTDRTPLWKVIKMLLLLLSSSSSSSNM